MIEREYEYKMYDAPIVTSGLPVFIPQFAYKQNSYAVGCTPSFGSLAYYEDATIIHNVSIASLGSTHGSAVGYRYVKEIETGNGYILRRYATPGMYEDLHDSDAPLAVPQCQVMVSGFCDGLFRRPTITYRPSLFDQQCNYLNMPPYCVYVLGYCGVNITGLPSFKSYPYAPSLNYDWNRGYLLFEKYFNNNNQEVKKIDYDYSIYYAENNNPKYIKCLNVGLMKNFMLQEPLFAYSFYEVITNVSKMPIRKTETIYSSDTPGDITKALTTTSEFDYNEKLLLKEEKVLQSDGIWFKTDYIYPKDLISGSISTTNPEVAALSLMIEKNILNRPIEIMNYKNGYVLSSPLRLYHTQLINNWPAAEYIVVPFEDWEIETSAPLTLSTTPSSGTFVKSYISGSISFVKDNHYTRRISYDMFDNKGNLLEYHKENDSHVAFIWDYNNSAVTAAANNAYNSQIAYTSFECETDLLLNSGNWKIGPGIIVDDYGKTGSRRYNGLLQSWYNLPVGKYGLSFFMQRKLGENGNIYVGSEIITALYSNKWEFVERIIEITTPGKISIAATGAFIDELTLCPVASQIRTFTHKPLFGITTSTNENNQIQYFEYDIMGRLSLIRDQDKYILKKFVYHYK
ncbi:MAG: hypothetical protein HY738_06005 [Bacteroidia bacterium]|nr:hypothetical protein [Bacteroidia bacterium]